MNKFELEVVSILKNSGFKILEENPKYVDILMEKDGKKIALEIKDEKDPTLFLPKALGQLMASKYIYETDEEWLLVRENNLYDSEYVKVMKENNIRFFTILDNNVIEIKDFLKKKRNREVRRGIDYKKLAKIWTVLSQAEDWLHVAEIARRTNIDECTVRWYLDRYLKDAVEDQKIGPKIKLRMIRLKTGLELESYIKALTLIDKIKGNKNAKQQ